MNFDRLRTFRALAESLHFRETAEKLHISQSANQDGGLGEDASRAAHERAR